MEPTQDSALVHLAATTRFEESEVSIIELDGCPFWPARQIGEALGYHGDGQRFVGKLTSDWSDELIEGTDYQVLRGERLAAVKAACPGLVDPRTPSLLVLSESGVNLAAQLSRQPASKKLRRWLADEVLPAIRKTGRYELPTTPPPAPVPQPAEPTLTMFVLQLAAQGMRARDIERLAALAFDRGQPARPPARSAPVQPALNEPPADTTDPWEADIAAWAQGRPPFTTSNALREALRIPTPSQNATHDKRLSRLLTRLGYQPGSPENADPRTRYLWFGPGQDPKTAPFPKPGNLFDAFLLDCCEIRTDARCGNTDLYARFVAYCRETDVPTRSHMSLSRALSDRGIRRDPSHGQTRSWIGLSLKGPAPANGGAR